MGGAKTRVMKKPSIGGPGLVKLAISGRRIVRIWWASMSKGVVNIILE